MRRCREIPRRALLLAPVSPRRTVRPVRRRHWPRLLYTDRALALLVPLVSWRRTNRGAVAHRNTRPDCGVRRRGTAATHAMNTNADPEHARARCCNCEHWTLIASAPDAMLCRTGHCDVFDKVTTYDHGSQCTAFSLIAPPAPNPPADAPSNGYVCIGFDMAVQTNAPEPLLPCPFCGGPASIEESDLLGDIRKSAGCGTEDCQGYQSTLTFATRREAIAAWNRRATQP